MGRRTLAPGPSPPRGRCTSPRPARRNRGAPAGRGCSTILPMRQVELRDRLEALYLHYDHRFVDPDPLQFVRAQSEDVDREVVGLVASALAFGNVATIKHSIATVLETLGGRPA